MTSVYSQCRLKAPQELPLSLLETKNYLKIDFADDDELLANMIATATARFESHTSYALIKQLWQVTYRQLGRILVTLPIRPAITLKKIQLVSFDGKISQFNLSEAWLDGDLSELHFHTFPYGYLVKVTYLAGYGEKACDIPANIKAALLSHVGYMYENRSVTACYNLSSYDEFKIMRL